MPLVDREAQVREIIREIEITADALKQVRARDVVSDVLRVLKRLNELKEALDEVLDEYADC